MTATIDDPAGPTLERLTHAGEFLYLVGRAKRDRRFIMLDNALGRALVRQNISQDEYSALRRYASHWHAGGLCGALRSVDLDRVHAIDAAAATGTERQHDHRQAYYAAREAIGFRQAWVADHVACYDTSMTSLGRILGYRSDAHGRDRAIELLREAGGRLGDFWSRRDRQH